MVRIIFILSVMMCSFNANADVTVGDYLLHKDNNVEIMGYVSGLGLGMLTVNYHMIKRNQKVYCPGEWIHNIDGLKGILNSEIDRLSKDNPTPERLRLLKTFAISEVLYQGLLRNFPCP